MANAESGSQGIGAQTGNVADDLTRKAGNVASEVREGLSKIVDEVKDKIAGDAIRKVSETASQVSGQVRGYIEDRGVRGLADDVTDVIRRYPMPALLCGVLIGVLLARPRGN